ncbi:MAG: hypothetical protein GY943_14940, partial [Chloroflexi bacterium]|nr:hypothetical protein [Chloroflexota bacterium]
INAANVAAGKDTIAFNIAGAGAHTIQPNSALPTITDPVIIDGYTQPGAAPNTNPTDQPVNALLMIELDGTNMSTGHNDGLRISAGDSTVRGLVINRFTGDGVQLQSNNGSIVEGNFIGVDVTGNVDVGNGFNGVIIQSSSTGNMIGGATPAARNLISGNDFAGVNIFTSSNTVQGNFIGTNAAGDAILGNIVVGVTIQTGSINNLVGGTTESVRNVISGNGSSGNEGGVTLITGAQFNWVQGNYIGTDVTGEFDLGNNGPGVYIFSASSTNNVIGGTESGAGNIVAYNQRDGFKLYSGSENSILGNAIYSNSDLGIDINDNGVTPNDIGDGDSGVNQLQNFPVITAVSATGDTIEGTLNSSANTQFHIELFANDACDVSEHGEGQYLLDTFQVTTNGSGNATFLISPATIALAGQFVTATATDPVGNSSEFSQCRAVGDAAGELEVEIDVEPGKVNNLILCRGATEVTVAILTTATFDALTVNNTTVTFAGASEVHTNRQTGEPARHEKDVDRDGDLDLVLHVRLGDTTLNCLSTEGVLSGETVTGEHFEGGDSVVMWNGR